MKILFVILFVVSCNYGWSMAISSKLDFNSGSREVGTSILRSPKIQGVRVTVDTSKVHQRSAESSSDEKEVISIDSKKKVGIRTDITFELDDEQNVSNSSISNENKEVGRDDDDNSGVPIFKGKPQPDEIPNPNRRTYQHNHDNPGFHQYDNGNNRPSYGQGPTFHTLDDDNINYNSDWSHFIPKTGIWTTERNYYPNINRRVLHNRVNGFNSVHKTYPPVTTWQNCNCNEVVKSDEEQRLYDNNVEGIRRNIYNYRQLNRSPVGFHPGVDDKLAEPFKVDRGR